MSRKMIAKPAIPPAIPRSRADAPPALFGTAAATAAVVVSKLMMTPP